MRHLGRGGICSLSGLVMAATVAMYGDYIPKCRKKISTLRLTMG